jgi:radical SAM superfamily enzyme YgiQ (UPF0313 family)
MPRIVFIEPQSPNLHIFSQFPLPRLGVFLLGTLAKEKGWTAEVLLEQSRPIVFDELRGADLVGISTITSTAPRAYAIADRVRAMGIPVLLGGPHVTFLPDEGLEHADFVFRGEAEEALVLFLEEWRGCRRFSEVPNLSFRGADGTAHNPRRSLKKSLDANPFPDFTLCVTPARKIGGKTIIPFQTSRGCPFHCSFCSVTGIFGRAYRFRSAENVIAELKRYDRKDNYVFFYDDNFTADRERAKELLRRMIEERFKFNWSTQVRADIARDTELVRLMKKAGCHTVFIGMESVNPKSLKSMKKQQTVEEVAGAVRALKRQRIHVHGMFVYGFDDDDWRTVRETVRFAKRARLSSTQFMILTPLPGSDFYDQVKCENRIQFRDWSLYDAHHAVFRPRGLSLFELQKAQIFSHSKFYSIMEVIRRALSFSWMDMSLAVYARNLNRTWQKKNRTFLAVMDLCRPKKEAKIQIDYQEQVRFEDEPARAAVRWSGARNAG